MTLRQQAACTKGEALMKSHKEKKQWICEKCLTFTHNNKQCPTCGYTINENSFIYTKKSKE